MLLSLEDKGPMDHKLIHRMIHDLRTPLNAVKGLLCLACQETDSPNKIRERLEVMGSIIDYLEGIVEESMDFNEVEEGRLILKQQEFSLKSLIESVKAIILPLTTEKGQIFEMKVTDFMEEYLVGDALRIRQILINLLSNSVKYTGVGGSIYFQISQARQNKSTVLTQFQISDSGIGMSREFLNKMFLPFEKEETADYPRQKGNGLGLYITNTLVRLMEGSIKVNSKPKIGSIFTVEIPLEISDGRMPADKPDNCRKAIWGSFNFSGKRVLVTEDDPDSLEILAELLCKTGLAVDKASDGIEAIRLFSESLPAYYDAILMDMVMPRMDGMEATRQIRTLDRPDGKQIAIIAITGDARKDAECDLQDALIDAFVLKPINYRILYEMLERIFMQSNGAKGCQ